MDKSLSAETKKAFAAKSWTSYDNYLNKNTFICVTS